MARDQLSSVRNAAQRFGVVHTPYLIRYMLLEYRVKKDVNAS